MTVLESVWVGTTFVVVFLGLFSVGLLIASNKVADLESARRASIGFVAAMAVWLVLYLVTQ